MPWTKIKNQYNNPKKLSSKNRKEKLKQHKHQGKNESQSKKLRLQKITKEKKMREWNKKKHTQLGKANGQMGQSKWAIKTLLAVEKVESVLCYYFYLLEHFNISFLVFYLLSDLHW